MDYESSSVCTLSLELSIQTLCLYMILLEAIKFLLGITTHCWPFQSYRFALGSTSDIARCLCSAFGHNAVLHVFVVLFDVGGLNDFYLLLDFMGSKEKFPVMA
jgi:hypothetical protein